MVEDSDYIVYIMSAERGDITHMHDQAVFVRRPRTGEDIKTGIGMVLDYEIIKTIRLASIDKGTRGSAGRKFPHAASKPLRIHKVFSAVFSLSASISAPAELLRIGQPWIFEGFLFFWTQAG